jgi:heptosyltransferase-1
VLASPLAGWGAKQWPLERYSELGRLLQDRLELSLVLNTAVRIPPVPATVPHVTGLAGLIDATRRAIAVVGVDSGPLHLAAALRKPGVALFGPTDPARNGPYCDTITVLRDPGHPISYKRDAAPSPGLASLGAARVLEALEASLRTHFQTR